MQKVHKSLPFGINLFCTWSWFFHVFHHLFHVEKGHFSWFEGVKIVTSGSQVSTMVLDPLGTWYPMGSHGVISISVIMGKAPRRMILEMYMSMFAIDDGTHHPWLWTSQSGLFSCQKGSKIDGFWTLNGWSKIPHFWHEKRVKNRWKKVHKSLPFGINFFTPRVWFFHLFHYKNVLKKSDFRGPKSTILGTPFSPLFRTSQDEYLWSQWSYPHMIYMATPPWDVTMCHHEMGYSGHGQTMENHEKTHKNHGFCGFPQVCQFPKKC